jgi:hypothetical protein
MDPRRISEEQARELWRRAAELQAAEQHRHDRLPAGERAPAGLSLEQVATAAEGAGIDPDYVRVALAEKQLPDSDRIDRDLWSARWLRAILREPDVIEAARPIAAPPARVHEALRIIAARPAYDLVHETTIGDDPLHDAVLVYRLGNTSSTFQNEMNFADARVLLCMLRPDEAGTRVSVRVPLYRRGVNLALTGGSAALLGWGGAAGGAAVSAIFGTAALAMAPVVAGGMAGALAGVAAYRGLYRLVYRGGVRAVKQLLQSIAMEAETVHD